MHSTDEDAAWDHTASVVLKTGHDPSREHSEWFQNEIHKKAFFHHWFWDIQQPRKKKVKDSHRPRMEAQKFHVRTNNLSEIRLDKLYIPFCSPDLPSCTEFPRRETHNLPILYVKFLYILMWLLPSYLI